MPVGVVSAEPNVEGFGGLKFFGEVLLLQNEAVIRLVIFVDVLF
jgi:hypothetical protein